MRIETGQVAVVTGGTSGIGANGWTGCWPIWSRAVSRCRRH
jgi:hypothetical protein